MINNKQCLVYTEDEAKSNFPTAAHASINYHNAINSLNHGIAEYLFSLNLAVVPESMISKLMMWQMLIKLIDEEFKSDF